MCAVCDNGNGGELYPSMAWIRSHTCPKGWGRSKIEYPTDDYSVSRSQGYVKSGKLPVYGYVTRYNTKYYNYITARVSKA